MRSFGIWAVRWPQLGELRSEWEVGWRIIGLDDADFSVGRVDEAASDELVIDRRRNIAFSAIRSARLRVRSVRELAASETVVGLVSCLNNYIGPLLSQFQRILMWKNIIASYYRST